jgi:hypothetical protein
MFVATLPHTRQKLSSLDDIIMGDSSSSIDQTNSWSFDQMIVVAAIVAALFAIFAIFAQLRSLLIIIKADIELIKTDVGGIKAYFPQMTDFWHPDSRNLQAVKMRPASFRDDVATHYECLEIEERGGKTVFLATCCVSGVKGVGGSVIVSHNLARNQPTASFQQLDLDAYIDLDDVRNTILLAKNIEQAYEKKQICFLQTEAIEDGTEDEPIFYMHIWDKVGIGDSPVFPKLPPEEPSDTKEKEPKMTRKERREARKLLPIPKIPMIKNFDGKAFRFPKGKVPFTRVLSHHARCSYAHAVNNNWIDPEKEKPPTRFGTPLKNDTLHLKVEELVFPPKRDSVAWNFPKANTASTDTTENESQEDETSTSYRESSRNDHFLGGASTADTTETMKWNIDFGWLRELNKD